MAKLKVDGFEKYLKQLNEMNQHADGYIKRAVYDGAAVVLKAVANAIQNLPTEEYHYTKGRISAITPQQKQGLLEGLGAAKMKNENGYINTKLGFDGYNSVKTKKYPKGQPNALIARSVESGTSQRPKTRFINNAVNAAKAQAEQAMARRFDEDLKQKVEE